MPDNKVMIAVTIDVASARNDGFCIGRAIDFKPGRTIRVAKVFQIQAIPKAHDTATIFGVFAKHNIAFTVARPNNQVMFTVAVDIASVGEVLAGIVSTARFAVDDKTIRATAICDFTQIDFRSRARLIRWHSLSEDNKGFAKVLGGLVATVLLCLWRADNEIAYAVVVDVTRIGNRGTGKLGQSLRPFDNKTS